MMMIVQIYMLSQLSESRNYLFMQVRPIPYGARISSLETISLHPCKFSSMHELTKVYKMMDDHVNHQCFPPATISLHYTCKELVRVCASFISLHHKSTCNGYMKHI